MEDDVTRRLHSAILVTVRESNITTSYSHPEGIHHPANARATPSEMKALLAMDAEERNSTPSAGGSPGKEGNLDVERGGLGAAGLRIGLEPTSGTPVKL